MTWFSIWCVIHQKWITHKVMYCWWNYSENFNLIALQRCGCDFVNMISWIVTQHNSLGTLYEITPRWMPQNLGDDKSTLVQIMPFQATNHYRSQCIYLCCHMVSLGHIVLTTKAAKMDDNVSDFHMHIIFISYLGKYHQSPFEHSFSFSLYSIDSDGFAKQSYDVDYKWHCNGNVEYVYCATDQGIFFQW